MNKSHSIFFDFYNFKVEVVSDWQEVLDLIQKDFYAFKISDKDLKTDFKLTIFQSAYPDNLIPEIQTTMQSQSSLTYDVEDERFNDYYGALLSHLNFTKNEANLYSLNKDKVHEVAYLIILSRAGKALDLKGLHKLHAFAVSYKDYAIVCMMPSKGGKSTLLIELLKNDKVKMISDDIPLIDTLGRIRSFPLKIGLDKIPDSLNVTNPDRNIYTMNRSLYGSKQLVCVEGISEKVVNKNQVFKKIILINAKRMHSKHSFVSPLKWTKMLKAIFYHGVIGVGTPIVFEYFWENTWKDFLKKAYIFSLRLLGFLMLLVRAENYSLKLGNQIDKAAQEILNIIESKY